MQESEEVSNKNNDQFSVNGYDLVTVQLRLAVWSAETWRSRPPIWRKNRVLGRSLAGDIRISWLERSLSLMVKVSFFFGQLPMFWYPRGNLLTFLTCRGIIPFDDFSATWLSQTQISAKTSTHGFFTHVSPQFPRIDHSQAWRKIAWRGPQKLRSWLICYSRASRQMRTQIPCWTWCSNTQLRRPGRGRAMETGSSSLKPTAMGIAWQESGIDFLTELGVQWIEWHTKATQCEKCLVQYMLV